MAKRIYIAVVVFGLIGGTLTFGFWAVNQFNLAFDNLSAPSLANTHAAYLAYKQSAELASTSPEISGAMATSTDQEIVSTSPEISFTFPESSTQVYIGCTYPITWESSSAVGSLQTALVDAGTRVAVGPNTGGIAKENTLGEGAQNLEWKVGNVWPGSYYIRVSKINGVEAEYRSKTFVINKMSDGITTNEREIVCKGSGGSF